MTPPPISTIHPEPMKRTYTTKVFRRNWQKGEPLRTLTAHSKRNHAQNLIDACADATEPVAIHQTTHGAKTWAVWHYTPGERKAYAAPAILKDPETVRQERGY
jgi:hypothetical protein